MKTDMDFEWPRVGVQTTTGRAGGQHEAGSETSSPYCSFILLSVKESFSAHSILTIFQK